MDGLRLPPGTGLPTGQSFYSVVEPLGRPGGNATAFLVQCTGGPYRGVPFAAKFFLSGRPERREAFRREIQYLRENDHPTILRVYDEGTLYDEYPFYISRYMATNMSQALRTSLPMMDRLLYASQLAAALVFLSSNKPPIVHRDIKPKNVFVNGRTCLLGDFGMLQRLGEEVHPETGPPGPVGYRTPELVRYARRGEPPIPASDLFQVGLVLCEIITGNNPLQPSAKFEDDLLLRPLAPIPGPLGVPLTNILSRMIAIDHETRPLPEEVLGTFNQYLVAEAQRLSATRIVR